MVATKAVVSAGGSLSTTWECEDGVNDSRDLGQDHVHLLWGGEEGAVGVSQEKGREEHLLSVSKCPCVPTDTPMQSSVADLTAEELRPAVLDIVEQQQQQWRAAADLDGSRQDCICPSNFSNQEAVWNVRS